jgi:hypothetical protein
MSRFDDLSTVDTNSDDLSLGDATTLSEIFAEDERINEWILSKEEEPDFESILNVGESSHISFTSTAAADAVARATTTTTNATEDGDNEDDSQGNRIAVPGKMNVLLGRGKHHVRHPGNAYLIKLVKLRSEEFTSASRSDRKRIVEEIMNKVMEKGSFIRYDRDIKAWVEVSSIYALEKVSQAFRYRIKIKGKAKAAPPARREPQPSSRAPSNSSNSSSPLLSDREILRAVGYDLCPITGVITPLTNADSSTEAASSEPPMDPSSGSSR